MKNFGTWIEGICSSEDLDSSGERIEIKGIDTSSFILDGVVTWEHKNDSSIQVIGKILESKKILEKKDCENKRHEHYWEKVGKKPYLYIACVLFDEMGHSGAKDALAMMKFDKLTDKDKTRHVIGFSIEGSRLSKEGSVIKACIARKVTLTNLPCNKMCIAEIMDDPTISSGYKLISKDKLKDIVKKCEDLENNLKKSDKYMRSLAFRAKKPTEPKKDYTKISATHGEFKLGQQIKPKRTMTASSIGNTDKLRTGDRISYGNKIKGRSGASIYKDPKTWEKKDKFMSNVRKAITASCGTGSAPSAKVGGEALTREKVMKSLSEEAWKNFDNKDQLVDFLGKKLLNFNEKEILAFAKTYAYVDMKKKEMILSDLVPVQEAVEDWVTKVDIEEKQVEELKKKMFEDRTLLEAPLKGEYHKSKDHICLELGYKADDLKKLKECSWIIESEVPEAKDLLEKRFSEIKSEIKKLVKDYSMAKSEGDVSKAQDIYSAILGDAIRGGTTGKSEHGVPGKNRPLHERGINPVVSVARDVKDGKMIGHYKERSLQGRRNERGDTEGAKRAAREIISEQKQMKKPNLPKSEDMAKARSDEGKTDEEKRLSRIGRNSRIKFRSDGPEGVYRGKVVRQRKPGEGDKIFGEAKNTNNLKSKLRKARSDEGKSFIETIRSRRVREPAKDPTHQPIEPKTGESRAGNEARIGKQPEHGMYGIASNKTIGRQATERHREKLQELKAQPKPNLPKSEQDFASKPGTYDAKMRQPAMPKTSSQMDKPKMPTMKSESRRSSDIPGVHAPRSSNKPGESEAGHAARGATKIKGEKGNYLREKARYTHEKKIKEQKQMSKPNLPKSEKDSVEDVKIDLKKD